jgi:hypothetical protein
MLQTVKFWVRFELSLEFFNLSNHSSRHMSFMLNYPVTEINTSNLVGGIEQMDRKVETSPPSVSRLSRKCGSLECVTIL